MAINVSELVRRLNTTREEFMNKLPQLGFDIGKKAIKIQDHLVDQIVRAWNAEKKKQKQMEEEARKEMVRIEQERILLERDGQKSSDINKRIQIPEKIVIKDLAKKLNFPLTDLLAILMKNGIMSSMNETIDFETATVIAEDIGFHVEKQVVQDEKQQEDVVLLDSILRSTEVAKLKPRPAVIVVMGHVDHGKTKLLDAIRKSHLAEKEAGGITQAIGAYQVKHKSRLLTFIDTPGHEAFTAMRSRGARVADIAILVLAADDGVKPQTKEALEIIKQAGLPFVVAINKIDKEGADIDRVKKQLVDLKLVPEDWGGNTICVPISAKQVKGIDDLLEMILLVSDLHREAIRADDKRSALGTIIDSHIDKGEGPLATVLVQIGTLHPGDLIVVGDIPGKVKAMKDFRGKFIPKASPSTPVQVLGLKSAPAVGDILQVIEDKKILKRKLKEHRSKADVVASVVQNATSGEGVKIQKRLLPVCIKADTLGSLEAILNSLKNFKHAEIGVEIVSKGLGNINERDVIEAKNSHALLLGFNIRVAPGAMEAQMREGVHIFTYDVIYDLLDKVRTELEKLLMPELVATTVGKVKILAAFRSSPAHKIVGGKVIEGEARPQLSVIIWRGEAKLGNGSITQLQSERKNVGSVKKGQECGIRLETGLDIAVGDVLEVVSQEERTRRLEL